MGRFCSLPKEGCRILLMVATEFVPKSHEKVALENLTLVLMQSTRKGTRLVLITANYVTK